MVRQHPSCNPPLWERDFSCPLIVEFQSHSSRWTAMWVIIKCYRFIFHVSSCSCWLDFSPNTIDSHGCKWEQRPVVFRKGEQREILLEEAVDEEPSAQGSGSKAPAGCHCSCPIQLVPASFPWNWPFPDQWGHFLGNCGRCSSNLFPDNFIKKKRMLSILRFKQKCFIPPMCIFKIPQNLKNHVICFCYQDLVLGFDYVLESLWRSRFYILWSFIVHVLQYVITQISYHLVFIPVVSSRPVEAISVWFTMFFGLIF